MLPMPPNRFKQTAKIRTRHQMKIQPPDVFQEKLTKGLILPHLPLILEDLWALRQAIDLLVFEMFVTDGGEGSRLLSGTKSSRFLPDGRLAKLVETRFKKHSLQIPQKYPIGLCYPITAVAFDYLLAELHANRAPGISTLSSFVSCGGTLKRVWGEIRGEYFQSALQVGTLYVDVANDTVNVSKPKVVCAPLPDSGFKDIESFEVYAQILRSYHKKEVFINTCFPKLAPFFPILSKNSVNNCLSLDTSMYMAALAMETNFEASRTFLLSGPYEGRQLPEQTLEHILRVFRTTEGYHFIRDMLVCRITALDELNAIFSQYQCGERSDQEDHYETARTAARFVNVILAKTAAGAI